MIAASPHHQTSTPDAVGQRLPHLRALDGLRGVAVALVVGYHLAPGAIPGGFLGVDVFFVLSGFLITSLLIEEASEAGRVDLRAFYVRRVRRLAPALLLLVAALSAYAAVEATTGELRRLREHSLWTLGYLANWRFITEGVTYTDLAVGQSPLRHAWSLAIEEQFYVVFPVAVLVLGTLVGWHAGRLRTALMGTAAVGTAASAAWMAVLWQEGQDPSRGYFGTDTRAHALLVGVGLGAVLVGRPPTGGRSARPIAAAATAGTAVLVLSVAIADEQAAWLQQGGFLVVALAVGAVIGGLEQVGWLRRALSTAPLVALGVVSYGVYLWHWPIIVLLTEARSGLGGPALVAARVGLTLVAAVASYWLVERPIRRGSLRRSLGRSANLVAPVALASVILLVVATTTTTLTAVPTAVAAAAPRPRPASTSEATRPPVDVVVLGDSVAHTLAGGWVGTDLDFQPWAPEQSPFDPDRVALWSVARPACTFLSQLPEEDGTPGIDPGGFCEGWQTDLDAALARRPGATVLVALANDASSQTIGGASVTLGEPDHAAHLGRLLDVVRAAAERHRGRVVMVALPPRTGESANDIDRDGQRERLMRAALRDYVDQHPSVALLDLFEVLCPGADCSRPAPGFDQGWRYDGLHFSPEGARWVAAWLTDDLTTEPTTEPTTGLPDGPVVWKASDATP